VLRAILERAQFLAQIEGDEIMLGIIAAILIIGWLLGLFAFHVSTGLFHVLLVIGLVSNLVAHWIGRRFSFEGGTLR